MIQLEALLARRPLPGGILLRGPPIAAGQEHHLVRQVMALANAELAGPRALVFGVESGPADAVSVFGLADSDLELLAAQCQLCLDAIEPQPGLNLVTATMAGQRIAALVLEDCSELPYVATGRGPAALRPGECWLFDAQGMRPALRRDFDSMYGTRRQRMQSIVLVGLGNDPRCDLLDLQVPPADRLPSQVAAEKIREAIAARQSAAAVMGRDDTKIVRLADARIFGADSPYRQQGVDALVKLLENVRENHREADLRYRFEDTAVQLNLCVMNGSPQPLTEASIEVALPLVPGLVVAPRHYGVAPGTRSTYPAVATSGKSVRVRAALGALLPGSTIAAFATALRLAVQPAFVGRKIAILYTLNAANLGEPMRGRLAIRFT